MRENIQKLYQARIHTFTPECMELQDGTFNFHLRHAVEGCLPSADSTMTSAFLERARKALRLHSHMATDTLRNTSSGCSSADSYRRTSSLTRQRRRPAWLSFNQTGGTMADRIISSRTHDAYMTVKDHVADGWVASVCIVRKGAAKGKELIKLDTFFEREDVAWESVETLARAELNNLK
jgi:hypothetical protein